MIKTFARIQWGYGVRVRQRVPIPTYNLPENFRIRPFSTKEVMRIDASDFPLEQMQDRAEFIEYLERNLAPQLGDGIFYIMAYGNHPQHWRARTKMKRIRIKIHGVVKIKRPKGYKNRNYMGLISLFKFEVGNGKVINTFQRRGRQKEYPHSYPNYPIHNLFKDT